MPPQAWTWANHGTSVGAIFLAADDGAGRYGQDARRHGGERDTESSFHDRIFPGQARLRARENSPCGVRERDGSGAVGRRSASVSSAIVAGWRRLRPSSFSTRDEPVAQRVRVDVHRLGGGVDVHVAREVLDQRLQQRRVRLQRREQLVDARADVLGRDLAQQQRREVEVLVGERPCWTRSTASCASRNERGTSAICSTGRPIPARRRRGAGQRRTRRRLDAARRARSPRARDEVRDAARRAAARARAASRERAAARRRRAASDDHPRRRREVQRRTTPRAPPARARRGCPPAPRRAARSGPRAPGRARGRRGARSPPAAAPRPAPRAGRAAPRARGRGWRPRASRRRRSARVTTCQPSCSNSRSPMRAARSSSGHRPAGRLDAAVGDEDQHAGVEHPREALDHHLARARLAQRVDQVALDRVQALVGVQVAGEQRAVDEADDVAERRCPAAPRAPGTRARGPPPAARAGRA